jgi:excinuclease UvrABC nuclease subunit
MKIGKLSSYPDITITKDFNFDGNDYFGLFISKRKAEEVFELIKKIFRLRECTDKELAKRKACFLYHIDRCTGPCINDDKKIYQAEVDNVQEFMSGKSQTALNRLLQKMKRFSEELKFERAQETKELIDLVLAQIQKTSLLAEPVNRADVLFEIISPAHQCDYILFLKGQVYIKGYMVNPLRNFDTALNDYFDQTIQRAEEPDEEDLEKVKITLNWMIRNRHQVIIHYLSSHLTRQSLELRLINRLNDRSLTHNEINITLEHFLTNEVKI